MAKRLSGVFKEPDILIRQTLRDRPDKVTKIDGRIDKERKLRIYTNGLEKLGFFSIELSTPRQIELYMGPSILLPIIGNNIFIYATLEDNDLSPAYASLIRLYTSFNKSINLFDSPWFTPKQSFIFLMILI